MDPVADDVEMAESTPREPNAQCGAEVISKTIRIKPQDNVEAQVPGPQTDEPGWKICINCADNGHVLETWPNEDKNKALNLNTAQMHHLGQNNNCNDMNATWVKGTNMDQLAESFQGLRPMSGSNSPARTPTSPNYIMQPLEGPELAESEEEGELRPSPVVSAQESAEEGELRPSPVTRRKKIAVTRLQRCNKDCIDCRRCGGIHYTGDVCPALEEECNNCGQGGHYEKRCHNYKDGEYMKPIAQKPDKHKQSRQKVIVTGGAHATEYENRKENITPWSSQERKKGTPTRSDREHRSRTDYDRGTQREPKHDRSRIRSDRNTPT